MSFGILHVVTKLIWKTIYSILTSNTLTQTVATKFSSFLFSLAEWFFAVWLVPHYTAGYVPISPRKGEQVFAT